MNDKYNTIYFLNLISFRKKRRKQLGFICMNREKSFSFPFCRFIKSQTNQNPNCISPSFTLQQFMASSSSSTNRVPLQGDNVNEVTQPQKQEQEQEDEKNGGKATQNLELGLRINSNSEQELRSGDLHRRRRRHHVSVPAKSSSSVSSTGSSIMQLQSQEGLGFGNEDVGDGSGTGSRNYRDHGSSSYAWQWHVGTGTGPRVQRDIPRTAGLWFTLQSVPNREGEMLPQLPRAYIRVKEENMTILTVKKYLVTKLGLTCVEEIDLSCMGQPVLDSQTLKYVRDVIWGRTLNRSMNAIAGETPLDLLLPLHYAKHCLG